MYNKSNLIHNRRDSFNKYYDIKKHTISNDLEIINWLKLKKARKKEKIVYHAACKSYDELLEKYLGKYKEQRRNKISIKYKPKKLKLTPQKFEGWSTEEEESADILPMPPLERDGKEVEEGKGLKILTSNKLLTSFPELLAQIKTIFHISYKTKSEKISYLLYQHSKSLNHFTTVLSLYNNGSDS